VHHADLPLLQSAALGFYTVVHIRIGKLLK